MPKTDDKHAAAFKKPDLIPFSEVAGNFSPDELEHLYPGITAPGGYLRYVANNPTGQAFIKRPETLQVETAPKPKAVVEVAATAPRKLTRDEIMKMFQDTIKGSPLKDAKGAGLPALKVTVGGSANPDARALQAVPQAGALSVPAIDTTPGKDAFAHHENLRTHEALQDPDVTLALADYVASKRGQK